MRMNEELTNEVLEAMKMCKHVCALCGANEACGNYSWQYTIQTLATALLEERAKPKVWDGAPDEAGRAAVTFYGNSRLRGTREYHRELPKTRIDKIVDEVLDGYLFGLRVEKGELTEILKSALNKYAEELENEGEVLQQHESNSSSVRHGRVVR
jgi:hypothetical protein